jgi:nucleotide-binding universal stress UspA family protein
MQAVRAGLPFMRGAPRVDVTLVNAKAEVVPAAELAPFLARHGVSANVEALDKGKAGVLDTLTAHADKIGAGMMVLGAYGHSRLRELVFGGVTRSVIGGVTRPVLIAR